MKVFILLTILQIRGTTAQEVDAVVLKDVETCVKVETEIKKILRKDKYYKLIDSHCRERKVY